MAHHRTAAEVLYDVFVVIGAESALTTRFTLSDDHAPPDTAT